MKVIDILNKCNASCKIKLLDNTMGLIAQGYAGQIKRTKALANFLEHELFYLSSHDEYIVFYIII